MQCRCLELETSSSRTVYIHTATCSTITPFKWGIYSEKALFAALIQRNRTQTESVNKQWRALAMN